MKTVAFGPFLGINNRLPAHSLRVATSQLNGQYLRDALNVDVDGSGKLVRRAATALMNSDTGVHSIHMVNDTTGYMVRASNLYRITLPTYAEVLVTALSSNSTMTYASLAGQLYASNGTDRLRIDGVMAFPYGLPTPAAPTCAPVVGGMSAGIYKVSISFFNSLTGEESGISPATSVTVTDTQSIEITLPAAPAGSTHTRLYVSTANGTVTYHHTTIVNPAASATISSGGVGWEAVQRFEDMLPAGRLFTSNGKLCSVVDNIVYVGIPFRPGYHIPSESYLPFPKNVSIAIENQGGTYIAADKTYFFPGDLAFSETTVVDVLPFGAVVGTEFSDPENQTVGWFSPKGFVIAGLNGDVTTPMLENIDLVAPASGCSVVLDGNGYKHVVSCGWSMNIDYNGAATRYDWDFTSVSGKYGTNATGIHTLEATGVVDSEIDFGQVHFGTENIKHMPNVYVGVNSQEALLLEVTTPSGMTYEYEARHYESGMKNQRFDLGKGLRETWFEFVLRNQGGADFEISTVSLLPTVTARRV